MVTINPMQLRNRNKTATQTSLEPTLNSEDSFKTRRVKEKSDFPIILSLSLAAFLIRIYNIYSPSQIVFDEVTFGSHISNYINGQFFIDIHPPLAKLLFSLVAWLFGYNGEFKFDAIGSSYTQDVPYTALRMLASIFGVFTVPLSYISLRNMGTNVLPAILASMFLMFENGLITQSRFILLDSILVFFTCFTLAMWTEFITYKNHEFSPPWWNSLILTGVGLGLTVSVKWIGLFAIATVGLFTLGNLWNIIDAKITMVYKSHIRKNSPLIS